MTGWASIHGYPIRVLANHRGVVVLAGGPQGHPVHPAGQPDRRPLVFLQNTTGYMVGKEYEQGGMIKHGAMMINAVSNSRSPT